MALDVVAVRQWWLEEKADGGCVSAVENVAVCQFAGSSAVRVSFRRSLKALICCVDVFCL